MAALIGGLTKGAGRMCAAHLKAEFGALPPPVTNEANPTAAANSVLLLTAHVFGQAGYVLTARPLQDE